MKIAKLEIQNFRSILNMTMNVDPVCAIVGANNAGKSNILLAIQRVLGRDWVSVSSFDEDDVYGRDPERDVSIKLWLEPPVQYKKFQQAPPADVGIISFQFTRYKIGASKGDRRLEQQCLTSAGGIVYVPSKAPKKGQGFATQPLLGIPPDIRDAVPLIYIGTNRSLKEQLPSARWSLLRAIFEDIDRDLHHPGQTVRVKGGDGSDQEIHRVELFRRRIAQAMALLRTEQFKTLEVSIKKNALRQLGFDPEVDTDKLDLFFSPIDTMDFYKSIELRVREGDFNINAAELGEGFQNAIVLAVLQAFAEHRKKGAILLIEEPEMFLHPQMQRSLYTTLRQIGQTNQVIYTTHSPHFVSVPEYQEVRLVRKANGGTEARQSNLPTNAARREKLLNELDPERNELFFASRLLLVEGDTEKLALPEYARRLKIDLDREGATIVEVGGKRNLPEFARIATSFGLPTGILYDEDSSDFGDKKQEFEFNKDLDSFAKHDGSVTVWRLVKKYEDHLRHAIGEKQYQEVCQKHSGVSKAVRARLIALEANLPIPEPVEEIIRWLGNSLAS